MRIVSSRTETKTFFFHFRKKRELSENEEVFEKFCEISFREDFRFRNKISFRESFHKIFVAKTKIFAKAFV
jgi:hypothetical protein